MHVTNGCEGLLEHWKVPVAEVKHLKLEIVACLEPTDEPWRDKIGRTAFPSAPDDELDLEHADRSLRRGSGVDAGVVRTRTR